MKKYTIFSSLLFLLITLTSCPPDDENDPVDYSKVIYFDIFTVENDRTTVTVNGEIKGSTLQDFNNMLQGHPTIQLFQFNNVPGSSDDEINFQVGVKMRQLGINTHILDDGIIASGGVDLFLAGLSRSRGNNTKLGVHSWSDESGNEATDYPLESNAHSANIKYYEDLGYSSQWARDFYFYTIQAAPADEIHWMTENEITQFNIFN